jgi:glucokinase
VECRNSPGLLRRYNSHVLENHSLVAAKVSLDQANEEYVIAVDVGGTKVAAGLVDGNGQITRKQRAVMVPDRTAENGFGVVKATIENLLSQARADGVTVSKIGVCAPGPLDPRVGVILNPPNLPCWRNFPLAAEIQRHFGVPARIDNDANAAALAEAIWGAAIGYSNVFYGTLGTGIGSGIVFDRRIYYGRTGSAAEAGHMTIDYRGPICGCGKRGCIEALCSGPAIARRARESVEKKQYTGRLVELAGCVGDIRAEHVSQGYIEGDALATEILTDTAQLLAVWIGNIVDLLEPDVIVLGGGVSEMISPMLGAIAEQVPGWSVNPRAAEIPIVLAKYGAESGIAGAAALVLSTD